jgi:peptidoglycan hydrolase-like protein with peptidoglycan-binding domain
MCIEASVGFGCINNAADVKIVQILLNMTGANPALVADGLYGKNTALAIDAFQAAKGQAQPSGRVDPGQTTIGQLGQAIQKKFDANSLQGVMTNASAARTAVPGTAGDQDGSRPHKPAAPAGAFPGADRS